jgi:predicted Fe-Mo cluster-binding NifX family protein
MKIAIPTHGKNGYKEKVALHFGRCETYTVLDENKNIVAILDNNSTHNGGLLLPPVFLKQQKIDILLCLSLGRKALDLCEKNNLLVYIGTKTTVDEIFNEWKEEKTKKASMKNTCSH